MLVLVALQYVAGRAFAAIEELNRTTPGRLASAIVPDAIVALSFVAGVAVLLAFDRRGDRRLELLVDSRRRGGVLRLQST